MRRFFVIIVALLSIARVLAQDITVTRFEHCNQVSVDINPIKDNAGEYCSVLRFWVRGKDDDYDVKFNNGILRRENRGGVILFWVPKETTRITKLRYKEDLPLSGYNIPIKLQPKMTYDATIELLSNRVERTSHHNDSLERITIETMPSKYFRLGFNIFELMGPSLSFGLNLSRHNIELGVVYGLKTTEELYVYGDRHELLAANYFHAFRTHLCYGFELPFPIEDKKGLQFFTLTPQVGGVFHLYKGTELVDAPQNNYYKYPFSIAISIGMRFA